MTLLLKVDASVGESEYKVLTQLRTLIELSLANHKGRTVCQAVGLPSKGVTTNNWVLTVGYGEAAYWHEKCTEIKFRRSESYTLKIRISDVDPRTPRVRLIPVLERSDDFGP